MAYLVLSSVLSLSATPNVLDGPRVSRQKGWRRKSRQKERSSIRDVRLEVVLVSWFGRWNGVCIKRNWDNKRDGPRRGGKYVTHTSTVTKTLTKTQTELGTDSSHEEKVAPWETDDDQPTGRRRGSGISFRNDRPCLVRISGKIEFRITSRVILKFFINYPPSHLPTYLPRCYVLITTISQKGGLDEKRHSLFQVNPPFLWYLFFGLFDL